MEIRILESLFENIFGGRPEVKELKGGGSPRRYFRLNLGDKSVVGVYSENISENLAFIKLAGMLEENSVDVPHVLTVDPSGMYYLIEDLGDVCLFDLLSEEDRVAMGEKALIQLIRIQKIPEEEWKDKVVYQPFSERLVRWDLNYFKYCFLKQKDIEFNESLLEDDFDRLILQLTESDILTGLMYRDFQSRNIMVKEGNYRFIDFQGMRKGPLFYDAVSFIWQAKAPFTFEERERLSYFYINEIKRLYPDLENVEKQMYLMEVFRTLQVLGAYGYRGLTQRKPHFLQSIPHAIDNLAYLYKKHRLEDYPELSAVTRKLIYEQEKPEVQKNDGLTLSVMSFSYKKGYPEDPSGNGGGFMFDCRAIHNPGRYEEYKNLTGKDASVIDFLEERGEVVPFLENAVKIVAPSIERYLKRGFTSLQVGFGCTGGQHRSVYCAERFAKIIQEKFPEVKVKVTHREQN